MTRHEARCTVEPRVSFADAAADLRGRVISKRLRHDSRDPDRGGPTRIG